MPEETPQPVNLDSLRLRVHALHREIEAIMEDVCNLALITAQQLNAEIQRTTTPKPGAASAP